MKSILITGASSGIGAALAVAYASPSTTLFLSGRNADRLQATAELCRAQGARIHTALIDIRDQEAMAAWVQACDAQAPLTLLIANAGASNFGERETPERVRTIFDINVTGTLNTVLPIIETMEARGAGHIALMSSLASFKGYAGKGAYCGAKAAIRLYGEGIREKLAPKGVCVSVICPGFVDTPLTVNNKHPMPFLMTAERAAQIIKRGLDKKHPRIAFPMGTYMGAWLMGVLPPRLAEGLSRLLPYHAPR